MVDQFNVRSNLRTGQAIPFNESECLPGGILATNALVSVDTNEPLTVVIDEKVADLDAKSLEVKSLTFTTQPTTQATLNAFEESAEIVLDFFGGFDGIQNTGVTFMRIGDVIHCQVGGIDGTSDNKSGMETNSDPIPDRFRPALPLSITPIKFTNLNAIQAVPGSCHLEDDGTQATLTIRSPGGAAFDDNCGWASFSMCWHAAGTTPQA